MRYYRTLGAVLAAGVMLAACTKESGNAGANGSVARQGATSPPSMAVSPTTSMYAAKPTRFAALPDRGELLHYDAQAPVRDGAYTWHRTELSEQHAFDAIKSGVLRVVTPTGKLLGFRYDRSVRHDESGDWTWIGHLSGQEGVQAILTFGKDAVYGSIGQPGTRPLRLTMQGGASWLVETDPSQLVGLASHAANPVSPDYQIVTPEALQRLRERRTTAASHMQAAELAASATAAFVPTVDLVIGYTQGFVTAKGSTSAVVTRLNSMVDTANVGLRNSQVNGQVRLVHTMQVNYTDTNDNGTALDQLTGSDGQNDIPVNAAFNALRQAREQYGADLVSLVRPFKTPEQDSCGVAWLIGQGKRGATVTPDSGWDFYGYSVVSDGIDKDEGDGKTYFCEEHTLAHELGHNMGSNHDRANSKGDDNVLNDPDDYGAFAYSFGYKPAAFYTIMAYGDSGQTSYLAFSNPRITFCGGVACGVANSEDNAQSLGKILPNVAQFRATVVPTSDPIPYLFAVNRQGASGTEIKVLAGNTNYSLFGSQSGTALGQTGTKANWVFRAGDFNADGIVDMFVVKKQGTTRTEVHVLDGKTQFTTWLLHSGTPLQPTGSDERWVFDLGDYNQDGYLDMFVIRRMGGTGQTEVHVLDGRNQFKTYLLHTATALHQTGSSPGWKFAVGDYNRDGHPDVYVIKRNTASGYVEVHVLNGANAFKSYLLHQGMPFRASGTSNDWEFKVGDYNQDGILDLYAVKKLGSRSTELHILNGADSYKTFLAHLATPIGMSGSDWTWDFSLAGG